MKSLDKVDLTKQAVSAIVWFSVSKVIDQIVSNNTSPVKWLDKPRITIGSYFLGAILAQACKRYTDEKIDDLIEWWKENIQPKLETQ
jgi:hypothetical protein